MVEPLHARAPSAGTHVMLGKLQAAAGQPAEAERHLREAVRLLPKANWTHLTLADFLRSAGRLREAEESAARATAR